jgi:hypothetical protein
MLLNIPTDASLLGKNIAGLQETFAPQEQQQEQGNQAMVKPTAGGAKELSHAGRDASDTQAFLQRRNER